LACETSFAICLFCANRLGCVRMSGGCGWMDDGLDVLYLGR